MSKQQYREAKRVSPIGESGMNICRSIVREHQAAKINEVLVDAYSASAIVQIYDAVNDANKAKLLTLPVARVADICFAMINKAAA